MDTEEFLAHHGVKGMKWGRRKSTTPSNGFQKTTRSMARNITKSRIELHENVKRGKGFYGKLGKLDKYTWGGNGRFERYHDIKIKELNNSLDEIKKGKKVVRTILFNAQYTV